MKTGLLVPALVLVGGVPARAASASVDQAVGAAAAGADATRRPPISR